MAKDLDFSMFDEDEELVETAVPESQDGLDLSMFDGDDQAPMEMAEIQEEPSQLEAAARGAAQGLTFDFGDEIAGVLEAGGEFLTEKKPNLEALLETYKRSRDESRESMEAAQEAHPWTYGAADIASGIIPAIATGGTTAVASAAKVGGKQALKQLAKSGAKYGAATGAGMSKADLLEGDVGGLAEDAAIGSGLGAITSMGMPYVAKGAGKVLKGTGKVIKGVVSALPGAEDMVTAFKYGKMGKKLSAKQVDDDIIDLADQLQRNIRNAKDNIDIGAAKKELESLGITVNTEKEINEAITDLQKISQGDIFEGKSNKVLDGLRRLRGDDLETEKLHGKIEQKDLSRRLKDLGLEDETQASLEKQAAEKAVRTGTDAPKLTKFTDDLLEGEGFEYPTKVMGVEDPDLGTFAKSAREYQPGQIQKGIDPKTGLPFVVQQDLASGKITSQVGKLTDKLERDINSMSISEVDDVINQINALTKIAQTEGATADPAIKRAMVLAGQLRDRMNKTIQDAGVDPALIDKRAKFSKIMSAEGLLNISKPKDLVKEVNEELMQVEIANKMGFDRGFKDRREMKLVQDLLGDQLNRGGLAEEFGFMRDVNRLLGREAVNETITKSSLYTQLIGKLPNMAGRGVKSAQESKVGKFGKNLMDMKKATYESFVKMVEDSGDSNMGKFLGPLKKAAESPHKRDIILWSLSQQPAFKKSVESFLRDGEEMEEQEAISTPDRTPQSVGEIEPVMMSPEMGDALEAESESIEDVYRVPQSMEDIEKWEGGNILQGYIPSEGSGITVSTGLDLKHFGDISKLGLSPELEKKLTPFVGLSGEEAKQAAPNLVITEEEAEEIKEAMKIYYEAMKEDIVPEDMPEEIREQLMSVLQNAGEKPAKLFIQRYQAGDLDAAINGYIQTNTSKGTFLPGLLIRRAEELIKMFPDHRDIIIVRAEEEFARRIKGSKEGGASLQKGKAGKKPWESYEGQID